MVVSGEMQAQRKEPQYMLDERLDGPRAGLYVSVASTGIRTRVRPARSLVAMPKTLRRPKLYSSNGINVHTYQCRYMRTECFVSEV